MIILEGLADSVTWDTAERHYAHDAYLRLFDTVASSATVQKTSHKRAIRNVRD